MSGTASTQEEDIFADCDVTAKMSLKPQRVALKDLPIPDIDEDEKFLKHLRPENRHGGQHYKTPRTQQVTTNQSSPHHNKSAYEVTSAIKAQQIGSGMTTKPNSSIGSFRPVNTLHRNTRSADKPLRFFSNPAKRAREGRSSSSPDPLGGGLPTIGVPSTPQRKRQRQERGPEHMSDKTNGSPGQVSILKRKRGDDHDGEESSNANPSRAPKTLKQRREFGRHALVSKNQRYQTENQVKSPYFRSESAVANGRATPAADETPRTLTPEQACTTEHSHDFFALENDTRFVSNGQHRVSDELAATPHTPDSVDVPVSLEHPSHKGSSNGKHGRTLNARLRVHEKAWRIKALFYNGNLYNEAAIDLVLDTATNVFRVRVANQLLSMDIPSSQIHQLHWAHTIIRLDVATRRPTQVYIWTLSDAEHLVTMLSKFSGVVAKPRESDERLTKMYTTLHVRIEQFKASRGKKRMRSDSPESLGPSQAEHNETSFAHDGRRPSLHDSSNIGRNIEEFNKPHIKKIERLRDQDNAKPSNASRNTISPARFYGSSSHVTPSTTQEPAETRSQMVRRRIKFSSDDEGHLEERVNVDRSAKVSIPKSNAKETTEGSSHDKLLEMYHAANPVDDSLRRSTRSRPTTTPKHIEMEEPEPEKYSKTHGLGTAWTEPLVYPKGGKKPVTVQFQDLERLDEGEFLNDNLVEFTLRYLRERKKDSSNIYWFNTYFYERLTQGRGKKIAYDGVKRWTKDVDLFSYDYAVVPINESYHWYMAIICNLPALKKGEGRPLPSDEHDDLCSINIDGSLTNVDDGLAALTGKISIDSSSTSSRDQHRKDDGTSVSSKKNAKNSKFGDKSKFRVKVRDPSLPTIITLDSLGGAHPQVIASLKSYLEAEAADKLDLTLDNDLLAGMTAKDIPAQQNLNDCGLYLLTYAAALLSGPKNFVTALLEKKAGRMNWANTDPASLRHEIRKKLQVAYAQQTGLLKSRSLKKSKSSKRVSSSSTNDTPRAPEQDVPPEATQDVMDDLYAALSVESTGEIVAQPRDNQSSSPGAEDNSAVQATHQESRSKPVQISLESKNDSSDSPNHHTGTIGSPRQVPNDHEHHNTDIEVELEQSPYKQWRQQQKDQIVDVEKHQRNAPDDNVELSPRSARRHRSSQKLSSSQNHDIRGTALQETVKIDDDDSPSKPPSSSVRSNESSIETPRRQGGMCREPVLPERPFLRHEVPETPQSSPTPEDLASRTVDLTSPAKQSSLSDEAHESETPEVEGNSSVDPPVTETSPSASLRSKLLGPLGSFKWRSKATT